MKMELKLKIMKLKSMNNKIYLIVFISIFLACQSKVETTYKLPDIPEKPTNRNPTEHSVYEVATKNAKELCIAYFCNCLSNPNQKQKENCEIFANQKMTDLLSMQKSEEVKKYMITSYNATKQNCIQNSIK